MKKVLLTLLVLVMVFTLSACSIECNYKVDKKGNISGSISQTYMADEIRMFAMMGAETEEEQAAIQNISDEKLVAGMMANMTPDDENAIIDMVEIGGKPGVRMTSDIDESMITNPEEAGYEYDATKFVFTNSDGVAATGAVSDETLEGSQLNTSEDLAAMITSTIKVTMPKKIVYTNGKLSKNGKTVTWDTENNPDDVTLFAYTADAAELVSLSNVKKNVTYKNSAKVTALSKIKAIYVNGEKIKSESKVTFPADGEYTIKVKTKDYTKTIVITKKTK